MKFNLGDREAKQPQPGRDHGRDTPEGQGSKNPAQICGQGVPPITFPLESVPSFIPTQPHALASPIPMACNCSSFFSYSSSYLVTMGQATRPPPVPCPSMLPQQLSELLLPNPPTWTLSPAIPTRVPCLRLFQTHSQSDLMTDSSSSPEKGLWLPIACRVDSSCSARPSHPAASWFTPPQGSPWEFHLHTSVSFPL